MKVRVDPDICMGCGVCESICPAVFELTDEGYAVVLVDIVTEPFQDEVREAADACSEEAIIIDES